MGNPPAARTGKRIDIKRATPRDIVVSGRGVCVRLNAATNVRYDAEKEKEKKPDDSVSHYSYCIIYFVVKLHRRIKLYSHVAAWLSDQLFVRTVYMGLFMRQFTRGL